MPSDAEFSLDDEQRSIVRDCLKKAGVSTTGAKFENLVDKIEASVRLFRSMTPEPSFRQIHDALRALWLLAHDNDASPALIRARLSKLPAAALRYMDDRARHIIPNFFPGHSIEDGFLAWAKAAKPQQLIEAVAVISAHGARVVFGRSRGGGKRSGRRLEPLILGEVRGGTDHRRQGGRPPARRRDQLVMHLALDWYTATEAMPKAGRSDRTGFGDLVHAVFDWNDEPGAAQALRRYWSQVPRTRPKKSRSA
jgi:hypothetical protein